MITIDVPQPVTAALVHRADDRAVMEHVEMPGLADEPDAWQRVRIHVRRNVIIVSARRNA